MASDPTVAIRVPLLNGGISGGEPHIFSDPSDALALMGLTTQVKDIYQVGEALQVRETRINFPSYRDHWLGVQNEVTTRLRWKQLESSEVNLDEREQLLVALTIVNELWSKEPPPDVNQEGMKLLVAIADPGGIIELEGEEPAFFLANGSIRPMIMGAKLYSIQAAFFVLALVPGVFPQAAGSIATTLVEETRARARARIAVDEAPLLDLTRLDNLAAGAIKNPLVLIMLHGLLSTDIGTFDEFLRRLNRAGLLAPAVIAVGWPHDTLTGISNNGHQLADLIHDRIGVTGPDFAFVCHSRGGLVARAAALRLYQTSARYRQALRGAITFGTPHEGADLASLSDDQFLSYFVCILASQRSGRISTLSQILEYKRRQTAGLIHGIDDLRPPDGPGFIEDLKNLEKGDPHKDQGKTRQLDIFSVGGDYADVSSTAFIFAKKYFGSSTHHDLVVPIASSIPPGTSGRLTMPCAHGDYCAEEMRSASGLAAAVNEVSRWLPL